MQLVGVQVRPAVAPQAPGLAPAICANQTDLVPAGLIEAQAVSAVAGVLRLAVAVVPLEAAGDADLVVLGSNSPGNKMKLDPAQSLRRCS